MRNATEIPAARGDPYAIPDAADGVAAPILPVRHIRPVPP